MTQMPWIRFFPSDWLGGTRGMSAVETGVFITLIMSMYEAGRPLPEDEGRLARTCGAPLPQFKKALLTLLQQGKIARTPQGLWNTRVERELCFTAEKSTAGLKAAQARWAKKDNKNNIPHVTTALRPLHECNASQKPEPDRKDSKGSFQKATRLKDDFIPDFDFAYQAGFTGQQSENLFANFKDYWQAKAGEGALKRDWQATWRNWVRSPYAQKIKIGDNNAVRQNSSFAHDVAAHMRTLATRHSTQSLERAPDRRLSQPLSDGHETKPERNPLDP